MRFRTADMRTIQRLAVAELDIELPEVDATPEPESVIYLESADSAGDVGLRPVSGS